MQVQTQLPISDSESIRQAVASRLAGRTVPSAKRGAIDFDVLRGHIRSYNGNERFVDLVERVYIALRFG
jgi:hypothetical protein